jgi:hypothetical protein
MFVRTLIRRNAAYIKAPCLSQAAIRYVESSAVMAAPYSNASARRLRLLALMDINA